MASSDAQTEMALRRELQDSIRGLLETQTLYVAAKLGLADVLADGTKSVDELANATNTHAPTLRRLLRYLASRGLFRQDEHGRFELTSKGSIFRGMTASAIYWGDSWNWSSWRSLLDSVRTGTTSFDLIHGVPLFEHLADNPEHASVFNNHMTALASARGFGAIAEAYDFSNAKRIVDVAGGHGALLIAILAANSNATGVLCDQPEVILGAQAPIANAALSTRCDLVNIDFFQSVPAGGDIYLLSNILHDWDDEDSLRILSNCRRAMGTGSKLLILEAVVKEDNEPSGAKQTDIMMLVLTGGLQRTEDEFASLLEKSGFRMTGTFPTDPSNAIIEAVPV